LYEQSNKSDTKNITKFSWCPDGKSIAFLSPDKKNPGENDREQSEQSGGDVEVFGSWKYTRPYLLDLDSLEVTTLHSENKQVEMLAWSPDTSQILLVTHQTPELESPFYSGIRFEALSIHGYSTASSNFMSDFPGPVLKCVEMERSS
jgi:Tol biopolymer transport system component